MKKRTSVFVLYVDTLAEEYEEMDRSGLRFGHNHFIAYKCRLENCIFFSNAKKPNCVIACRKTKLFISTLLDPHVFFFISVGDDSGFPSRMRQSS